MAFSSGERFRSASNSARRVIICDNILTCVSLFGVSMRVLSKYQVPSNFSEKQIEADLATFFGLCSLGEEEPPFRLLDVDEQIFGADKKFDGVIPIFMQFKKSTGLLSPLEYPVSQKKGRSRLEDIREWRHAQGFDECRSLYFKLHEKAKTATEYQHNVLLSYERPPKTRAIYVAPLSLDSDTYFTQLTESARGMMWPYYHRFAYEVRQGKELVYFFEVPFLRAHISIPPHERVEDANHFYSFSETATNVSWHSPLLISDGPSRLSDYLGRMIREILLGPENDTSLESAAKHVADVAESYGFGESSGRFESPLEMLKQHGRWINKTFGIKQFLFCYKKDHRHLQGRIN
ncbi:hypothetical protein ABOC32_28635 [Pseudomonas sp. WOUb67]|uniref:hypothetical protein n=1 Tax=Pseudomonas sp. WOUb67 TaxID=3161136 RepID=UPI003CE8044F